MIIFLTGLIKGFMKQTPGLVVEELGGGSHNQFHVRVIERVMVRMLWEGQDDLLMESVADATVVSEEVVTLSEWTEWYIN